MPETWRHGLKTKQIEGCGVKGGVWLQFINSDGNCVYRPALLEGK